MDASTQSRKLIRIGIGDALPSVPTWQPNEQFPPKLKWWIEGVGVNPGAPIGCSVSNYMYWDLKKWEGFVKKFGWEDLFYARDTGLFRHSMSRITVEHAIEFEGKLAEYRALHPQAIAKACKCIECVGRNPKDAVHDPTADAVLAVLVWLAYWARWAVVRCTTPAIAQH